MAKYYVEFKCWNEGEIDDPWPIVFFEETNEYRKRNDLTVVVPAGAVRKAFMDQNADTAMKFLMENVSTVILGAVIPGSSKFEALGELRQVFGVIEVIGVLEINDDNQSMISRIMGKEI